MMRRMLLWLTFALVTSTQVARAQRLAVESLVDVEGWKTDDGSRLLARNGGKPSHTLRGRLWTVFELFDGVQVRGLSEIENVDHAKTDIELEGLSLRIKRSRTVVFEAGKILMPLGTFGARRFSNANPLIGAPDMYPSEYPIGANVSGALGHWDYKAAVVSLPPVNTNYTTEPTARARPVVGLGWSPDAQFRVGTTYTQGSYLGSSTASSIPLNAQWSQYDQRLLAFDAHWSIGYLDTRAEVVHVSYEVPTVSGSNAGDGWYAEARYTLSPRWFVSGRYEDYNYPFVKPVSRARWISSVTRQMNGEIGVGYRANADLLFKTSLRQDHWPVHVKSNGQLYPDGYALAMQLSWHASLTDLLSRP